MKICPISKTECNAEECGLGILTIDDYADATLSWHCSIKAIARILCVKYREEIGLGISPGAD
jgi:hypothetical protein